MAASASASLSFRFLLREFFLLSGWGTMIGSSVFFVVVVASVSVWGVGFSARGAISSNVGELVGLLVAFNSGSLDLAANTGFPLAGLSPEGFVSADFLSLAFGLSLVVAASFAAFAAAITAVSLFFASKV